MPISLFFFFFNDTATTEIYTLSLHDALPTSPICRGSRPCCVRSNIWPLDRKSTRLNSSHVEISYAVFCLKKKKKSTNSSELYQGNIDVIYDEDNIHNK